MMKAHRVPTEETVNLREAKANLSSLTKQAKGGTRVVITNHGTPIADLVPHGTGANPIRFLKRPGPLPTPATKTSTFPPLCRQISGPVVR